jgi:hypothetical protein
MKFIPFMHITLSITAIILQVIVACYAWKLYMMIKPLPYWTRAWGIFFIGMVIVIIRRMWSVYAWWSGCYVNGWHGLVESLFLLAVSITWLVFIWDLKQLFGKYIGKIGRGKNAA